MPRVLVVPRLSMPGIFPDEASAIRWIKDNVATPASIIELPDEVTTITPTEMRQRPAVTVDNPPMRGNPALRDFERVTVVRP